MSDVQQAEDQPPPPLEEGGPARKVGFGTPPVEHQFKPGQSGNPKGRPKLMGSLALSYVRTTNAPVVMTKGKSKQRVSKAEMSLRLLVQKALQGDWPAFRQLIKKGVELRAIKPIKVPDTTGGVVVMHIEFFRKSKAEQAKELRAEIIRRNSLLLQGKPYDRAQLGFRFGSSPAE